MASIGDKISADLEQAIYPGWTHTEFLDEIFEKLASSGELDSVEAVAALARHADNARVGQRLRERSPKLRVEGLAALAANPEPLRAEARPAVRALFQQALLTEPALADGLPAAALPLAAQLLKQSGHALPPTTAWRSPWDTPPAKKKSSKRPPPALPAWPERFEADDPTLVLAVPPQQLRDAEAERQWNERGYQGRKFLWPLSDLNDASALRIWNSVKPADLWVYGDELAVFVPRFGLAGLDASLALVAENPGTIAALATLDSPRAAPLMADALASRPALKAVARAWFDRFPEAGAAGLVPAALGRDRTALQRSLEGLRHLRRVHKAALASGLARYEPQVREAIEELLARGAELPPRKPVLPELADPRALPRPIAADGTSLQGEALGDLIRLLKLTPLDGAPWIADFRAAFTHPSLVHLARALFDSWVCEGAPPKEKWALQALAQFPDDAIANELAAMAAELAPRGLSARAQEMVEVLAAMQTRTSLKLVHQLARKVRSKSFRARAELAFSSAAEKMGLTEDELAERLVPDYGLTPDGVLPVEPRIRLELDGLKPRFVDEKGKVVKALPEVADEESAAQLKELKKRAAALAREIAERLERRMSNGRTMSVEHFTEVYVMHGLARRVAERTVWGVYGATLEKTFALSQKGVVDETGKPLVLTEGSAVGVAHPLELSAGQLAAWSPRFGDQPFEQLSRRSVKLAGVGALREAVQPFIGRTVDTGRLLKLEKLGWQRGPVQDGGCYWTVLRALPTGRVELVFTPGIYLGEPMMNPEQRIENIEINLREPTAPVMLSELEHDLQAAFS